MNAPSLDLVFFLFPTRALDASVYGLSLSTNIFGRSIRAANHPSATTSRVIHFHFFFATTIYYVVLCVVMEKEK